MGDDRGIATVWAAALMQLLLVVAALALAMGSLVVARFRVATVADLAAVAAVQGTGCADAQALVRIHAMDVRTCTVVGADVVVEVVGRPPAPLVRLSSWLGHGAPEVTAMSRAGP
jgi:secretion/DNA translocation related TadE-like protein